MVSRGYKKYMKKDAKNSSPLIKIFIVSFFGMLLICTFLFNYLSKVMTVDTSIGDYKEQQTELEDKKIVDVNSLEQIQNEDQGRNFSDIVDQQTKTQEEPDAEASYNTTYTQEESQSVSSEVSKPDTVYKVFIGSYTSAEQAKVAKDIILESATGLNPIVKCLGTSNYTLQVGIFKNKSSADALLSTIQSSHLPGRIVQEN